VRELYDHLLATLGQFGPVKAFAVKTRIILQAETQFAIAMPRKHHLDGAFWLARQAHHPLITKVEMGVFRDYGHYFRLSTPDDIDDRLVDLLSEAYAVGSGAFLK
jgi:hypothetical protein